METNIPRKRLSDDFSERDLEEPEGENQWCKRFVISLMVVDSKKVKEMLITQMFKGWNPRKLVEPIISLLVQDQLHDKFKIIVHVEIRRNKHSFDSKPPGKVKFWDPTKEDHNQQPKVTTTIVVSRGGGGKALKTSINVDSNLKNLTSNGHEDPKSSFGSTKHTKREQIKDAMRVYDKAYRQLLQAKTLNSKGVKISHWKVSLEAAKLAKRTLKWMESEKSLGRICGVQIGDKFKHRAQLKMIGLHCQLLSGIDYANINGKNLAISIVDSHRYSNESASGDKLIYCGHGGLGFSGRKLPPEDQKLKFGNMAMVNSMDEGTPVRVIRKVGAQRNEMFVYDGLYVVSYCTLKRNEGKSMFKFYLDREPGQPPLHQMLNE